MKKYAKIINTMTNQCEVGLGTNDLFYTSLGMIEMDVEKGWNGKWYVEGCAPQQPAPTKEEQRQKRANAYQHEKDPITCQIESLRDEEQTPEIVAEIEELKQKRTQVVEDIHARYPYPVE